MAKIDHRQLKRDYFWNTAASIVNSAASVALPIVVARVLGAAVGGVYSLAFSVAQQFQVVGQFEMRTFQSTDLKERYPFGVYYSSRILTCAAMLVCMSVYACTTSQQFAVVTLMILVSGMRVLDAIEDVIQGMLQQRGRLDIAGKAMFFRVLTTVIVFSAVVILTRNLIVACLLAIGISAVVLYFLNYIPARKYVTVRPVFDMKSVGSLLYSCLPLFVGQFLLMFLVNEPRFAIQSFLADEYQLFYTAIFLPSLVINLLSGFVFRPLLTSLASTWTEGNTRGFLTIVGRGLVAVLASTVLCAVLVWFAGVPVLSFLYGVDLSDFHVELTVLLLGGLFNALSVIAYLALVTMRGQRMIIIGYAIAACVSFLIATPLVSSMQLMGAALTYVLSMFTVCAIFFLALFWRIRLQRRLDKQGAES